MFHLHDIKNRLRVPCAWFNRVAAFLNNLAPGFGISIRRPDNPTSGDPVEIAVDPEGLDKLGFARLAPHKNDTSLSLADRAGNAPKTVLAPVANESNTDKAARVGTSMFAARADHEHRLPSGYLNHSHSYTANDIAYGDDKVKDVLDDIAEYDSDNDEYVAIVTPPKEPTASTQTTSGATGGTNAATYDSTAAFTAGSGSIEICLACRSTQNGQTGHIFFRPFKITNDGRIYSIGGENQAVAAFADWMIA